VLGPPLCEGLLCDCCVGVVNLTFSYPKCISIYYFPIDLHLLIININLFLSLKLFNKFIFLPTRNELGVGTLK
jgi:hypothetical protein